MSLTNGAGKLRIQMEENETRAFSFALHKNQLKGDLKKAQPKICNSETARGKMYGKHVMNKGKDFLHRIPVTEKARPMTEQ